MWVRRPYGGIVYDHGGCGPDAAHRCVVISRRSPNDPPAAVAIASALSRAAARPRCIERGREGSATNTTPLLLVRANGEAQGRSAPRNSRLCSSTRTVWRNECRIATHLTPLRPLMIAIPPDVVVQRRDLRAVHAECCEGVANCCWRSVRCLCHKRGCAQRVDREESKRGPEPRRRPSARRR